MLRTSHKVVHLYPIMWLFENLHCLNWASALLKTFPDHLLRIWACPLWRFRTATSHLIGYVTWLKSTRHQPVGRNRSTSAGKKTDLKHWLTRRHLSAHLQKSPSSSTKPHLYTLQGVWRPKKLQKRGKQWTELPWEKEVQGLSEQDRVRWRLTSLISLPLPLPIQSHVGQVLLRWTSSTVDWTTPKHLLWKHGSETRMRTGWRKNLLVHLHLS